MVYSPKQIAPPQSRYVERSKPLLSELRVAGVHASASILELDSPAQCTAVYCCAVSQVSPQATGTAILGLDSNAPIPNNYVLKGIAHMSHQSQLFEAGQQEDAMLFYNWITNTLNDNPEQVASSLHDFDTFG